MIERVLDHLAGHGVDRGGAVARLPPRRRSSSLFPDGALRRRRTLTYAVEPEPLDTAGAIRFAARHAGIDERFLAVNGDVLTDLDIDRPGRVPRATRRPRRTIAPRPGRRPVGVRPSCPPTSDGRVAGLRREAGAAGRGARTRDINAGTYVLEPSVLDRIPGGPAGVHRARGVPGARRPTARSTPWLDDAYWTDTGTPAQYLQAQLDLICRAPARPAGAGAVRATGRACGRSAVGRRRRRRRPRALGDGRLCRRRRPRGARSSASGARVHDGARVSSDSVLLAGCRRSARGPWSSARSWASGRSSARGAPLARPQRASADRRQGGGRRRARRRPGRAGGLSVRTLVTGGAGFIGSTLVDRLLAEGHAVDVVDDLSSGRSPTWPRRGPTRGHDFTFHRLDIRVAGARRAHGPAPARGGVPPGRPGRRARLGGQRPSFDAEVNIIGTLNVLEGARQAGTPQGRVRRQRRHALRRARASCPCASRTRSGRCRPTACPRRRRPTTSPPTASCTASSSPPSPWPTSTAPARTPTARRVSSPSSPAACWPGSRAPSSATASRPRDFVYVDDVVDAFARAATRGSGLLMNIGTGDGDVGQPALRDHGRRRRRHRAAHATPRRGRASWPGRRSTRPGPASTWAGSRGPSWQKAAARCCAGSATRTALAA